MTMGEQSDFPLSYCQIVGEWPDFTVVMNLQNAFELIRFCFGGRSQEIRDICMDFKHA